MSVSKDVKKYVDETVKTFGKIDMFYNNAGISGPGTRFADNTIEEIEQVVGINLLGALYGIKYVLEVMLKKWRGLYCQYIFNCRLSWPRNSWYIRRNQAWLRRYYENHCNRICT